MKRKLARFYFSYYSVNSKNLINFKNIFSEKFIAVDVTIGVSSASLEQTLENKYVPITGGNVTGIPCFGDRRFIIVYLMGESSSVGERMGQLYG